MANFGFQKSVIDGSERIFGATYPSQDLPQSYSFRRFMPNVLDQGANPICVPCSISAYLNWRENIPTGSKKDNKIDYFDIYACKTNDGEGMTFKEAFKYIKHNGAKSKIGELYIEGYAMVTNFMSLKQAIIMNGPCVGALPVYNFNAEFWKKNWGDSLQGYHAISIVGYNSEGFIIRNSWGASFGNNGYTLLKYEDFNKFVEIWTIVE